MEELENNMAQNYVDLGLPSGTLWATENDETNYFHGLYSFDEAVEDCGDRLPTRDDWQELLDNVPHSFNKERAGLLFTARNGNELFLPITGFSNDSDTFETHYYGYYLSATPTDQQSVYSLYFDQRTASILGGISRNKSFYVKLIKRG